MRFFLDERSRSEFEREISRSEFQWKITYFRPTPVIVYANNI